MSIYDPRTGVTRNEHAQPSEHNTLPAMGHLAENLAKELRAADIIINHMLNAMTASQKAKLARKLEELGVSPDGMTRAHERHDELSRYDSVRSRLDPAKSAPQHRSSRTRPA